MPQLLTGLNDLQLLIRARPREDDLLLLDPEREKVELVLLRSQDVLARDDQRLRLDPALLRAAHVVRVEVGLLRDDAHLPRDRLRGFRLVACHHYHLDPGGFALFHGLFDRRLRRVLQREQPDEGEGFLREKLVLELGEVEFVGDWELQFHFREREHSESFVRLGVVEHLERVEGFAVDFLFLVPD